MKKILSAIFIVFMFYSCSNKKPQRYRIVKSGFAKRLKGELAIKLYGIGIDGSNELANEKARRFLTLQKKGMQFIIDSSSFSVYSFPGISALGNNLKTEKRKDASGNIVNIIKASGKYIPKRRLLYTEIDRKVYLKLLSSKPDEVMEFVIKNHFKPLTDKGYRIAGVCFITGLPNLPGEGALPAVISVRFTIIFRRG
jgi:hypothetical protein